jgi:hypothetical protein
MPYGFVGDTQQRYRPGIAMRPAPVWNPSGETAAAHASKIDSRVRGFFLPSNLDLWLKDGTYAGVTLRTDLRYWFNDQNAVPSGDLADPNNAAYNWSLFDAVEGLTLWSPGDLGLALRVGASFGEGRAPNWFGTQGWLWINSNGAEQVNVCVGTTAGDACRAAIKDIITAWWTRYGTASAAWLFGISECLFAGSSVWPAGFTRDAQNRGYADILNHIRSITGGVITPEMGANSADGVGPYVVGVMCFGNPDPKIGNSSCSVDVNDPAWPNCAAGSARRFLQDNKDKHITYACYERNGMTNSPVVAGAWADIDNPFGYDGSTPQHLATFEEALFWNTYVIPSQVHEIYLNEHGANEPALTAPLVKAAFDKYMAGGLDVVPYLPAFYVQGDAEGGDGEYTFVATGTVSSSGSPGQPAGKSIGDLLVCKVQARLNSETLNSAPSNGGASWVIAASVGSEAYLLKIAEDTDTTQSSLDAIVGHDFHSGTSDARAQIACFTGDVYPDLATIVAHSHGYIFSGSTADMPTDGMAITVPNCLIIGGAKKAKTSTSNGATITSPAGLSHRIGSSWVNGSVVGFVWDYEQQTDATDIAAGIWDQSVEEGSYGSSLLVALKTVVPAVTLPDVPSTVAGTEQGVDSIKVTHDDESGADGYRYYLTEINGTDIDPPQFIADRTQAQKTTDGGYTITGLASGTPYKGAVSAYNSAGETDLSSEWSETTDTPVDTTPPSFAGITGLTYNAETGEVTASFAKGTDGVTAQAELRYYAHVAVSPADPDFGVDDYGPFVDVTEIVIEDLPDGTYNVGVSVKDDSNNRSEDTTMLSVVVAAPEYPSVRLGPLRNNTNAILAAGHAAKLCIWRSSDAIAVAGTTADDTVIVETEADGLVTYISPGYSGPIIWQAIGFDEVIGDYRMGAGSAVLA